MSVSKHLSRNTLTARLIAVGAFLTVALLMANASGVTPPFASAFFELDGNVKHDAVATPPDDWQTLAAGGGSSLRFSGISEDVVNGTEKASTGTSNVCSGILPAGSTISTCDDVATGGNTKDDQDFSKWLWQYQQTNDKDDIEHTFAALYTEATSGHHFLTFGLDKLSNSGDASIGFWFTQNAIGVVQPGLNNKPNGTFSGVHKTGDILVQTDLTSGGGISRVEIFLWNSAGGGPASHPNLISQGKEAFNCSSAQSVTAGFCGIATQSATTNAGTAWSYLYKFPGGVASSSTYPPSTFFEGGVDLTKLFPGGNVPCISTGIGETRTSQSETAVLEDFHLFSFEVCSAQIQIAPNGVNEVNGTHTITATVKGNDAGTLSNAPDGTVVTFTKSGAGSFVGGVNTCTTTAGQCSITITSAVAGTTTVNASATVDFGGGVTKSASTDGVSPNSGAVTKRWVDGSVSIGPSAVNEVGHQHIFTITATAIPSGTTAQFDSITPSVTPAPGSMSSTCATPTVNGNVATCTVTINNNSAATFTANASVQMTFTDSDQGANPSTATITRSTSGNAGPGGSGSATKRFVDAQISIAPSASNEVGHAHTFTVTVLQDDGTGSGAVAATVGNVDVTLSNSNGATSVLDAANSTCDDNQPSGDNLDSNGRCTVVFTSNSAGKVTGHATVALTVGGVDLTRSTDGVSPNSADAVKTFVDARISISPDATNFIYTNHTFTVLVEANDGTGSGFQPVQGLNPTVTLTNTLGATATIGTNGCQTTGTGADGKCTVVVSSPTTGTTTAHAAVTLTVSGVSLSRETDGTHGSSGDATKIWVSAQVTLHKTFEIGVFTTPGQACFTLSRANPIPPPPVSSDTAIQCGTPDATGHLDTTWHDLVPGDYTITESTTPAGYTTMDPITFTVTNDTASQSNLVREFSRNDPLLPGSFKIRKTISGSTDLGGNSFQFSVQPCGSDATCAAAGAQIANSPFTVDNTHNPITVSGLSEGYYLVTEVNIPSSFSPDVNPQIVAVHAGDVGAGNPVTVTFNNKPTEFTALAPTQTTCDQFATGQAPPLEDITYGVQNGVINSVSPGVFFFYASYSVTGSPLTLTVDAHERFNANNGSLTNDFVVSNGQAFLYRFAGGVCTKLSTGVTTSITGGQVVIALDPAGTTPVSNGTYVLGVKYTPASSLLGSAPCHGSGTSCHYYFTPSRDGAELTSRSQSLLFRKRI